MLIKESGAKKWNQEVFFENGDRRYVENVTDVQQGHWYHVMTDKYEYIFNPDKIMFVRVWKPENKSKRRGDGKTT